MVASNAPFGLKPARVIGMGPEELGTASLPIQSAYATSIFLGDPVVMASGYITKAAYTFSANGTIGVFAGCKYTDPTSKQPRWSNYWPASTTASDAMAFVYTDPWQVFQVQSSGAMVATDYNLNVSLTNSLGGNTTSGVSTGTVDGANAATTNTFQYRIVGLAELPNNAWTDTYPIVLVVANFGFHQYLANTGA